MRVGIRICGAGGQGVISAANLLARCAVSKSLYAVQTQSYGPASRGGFSKGEVVVSDERIGYPFVKKPDILVAMLQEAYDRFIDDVKESTLIIIDPDLVKGEGLEVKAKSVAGSIGSRQSANIVMLGAMAPFLRLIEPEDLRRSIRERFSNEINLKCFDAGLEIGKKAGKKLRTKEIECKVEKEKAI